jgi:hypothetical protein
MENQLGIKLVNDRNIRNNKNKKNNIICEEEKNNTTDRILIAPQDKGE